MTGEQEAVEPQSILASVRSFPCYDVPSQIGIFDFVDDNTLDWKTTASDRPRPIDFVPNEADCTLYELRRMR